MRAIVPLTLVGFGIYLAVTYHTVLTAVSSVLCVVLFLQLAMGMWRRQVRSLGDLVQVVGSAGLPTASLLFLFGSVGEQQRWPGPFNYALASVACLLLLGTLVYSLGGKRRLLAAMDARAARHSHS
jgi:hypothetical protein